MEELIAVDTEAIFEVRNPIGIYGKICFTQGLFCRGFTGAARTYQPCRRMLSPKGKTVFRLSYFPNTDTAITKDCHYVTAV